MAKKVTIEHLAGMIQKGFSDASKETKKGFAEVNERLENIEDIMIKRPENEIQALKIRVKNLEDLFAMPLKK